MINRRKLIVAGAASALARPALAFPEVSVPRDQLAFPAGYAPGFDQTHIAAPGCAFSSVANFGYNLLNAKKSTLTGTGAITAATNGTIGPAPLFNSTTSAAAFAGPIALPSPVVWGAITIPNVFTSFTPIMMGTNTGLKGAYLAYNNASAFLVGVAGGTNVGTPALAITLVAGTPYFIGFCATGSPTILSTFAVVITNLRTGQIYSFSGSLVGTVTGIAASDGTYSLGSLALFGQTPNANFAAAMQSNGFALTTTQLKQWAQDPWSFWYPRTNSPTVMRR